MIFSVNHKIFGGHGAPGFCNVMLKESDIRHQHAKVHHFQHQIFADKKNRNPSMHWVQQKKNVKQSVKDEVLTSYESWHVFAD